MADCIRPGRIFFFAAALILSWFLSCSKPEETFFAKVGDETLTAAMIDSALRKDLRDQESHRLSYTQQWVNSELLHQKAVKEGYEKDERYTRRLREISRELLVQMYLEDEWERGIKVLPQELDEYYQKHLDEFITAEDHVQAEYFATQNRNRALDVARQFRSLSRLRKKDFLDVINATMTEEDITGTTEFMPRSRFDIRAGKQLFQKSATDDIIGPLPFGQGYYVIWHILEIRPKGTPRPFETVAAEIENRIRTVKRIKYTDDMIRNLKNEIPVHYPEISP